MQRDVGAARTAGWVLGADDPLAALQALARAWRDELGCPGGRDHRLDRQDLGQGHLPGAASRRRSTPAPRTSTPRSACRWRCSRRPRGPRCWCSRWRCGARARSPSSARSPSPTWRVITNVGPVHVELLGSVEAIAAAKAEILDGLRPGGDRGRPGRRRGARAAPRSGRRGCSASAPAATSRRSRSRPRRGRPTPWSRTPAGEQRFELPVRRGAQPRQRPGGDRGGRRARIPAR